MNFGSFVETNGTRWPVERAWREVEPDVWAGNDGMLSIAVHEGGLLDPARCRSAKSEHAVGWRLVHTINGTAVSAQYPEQDAYVLLYYVRVDPPHVGAEPDTLYELQATYVCADESSLRKLRDLVEDRPISSSDYGTLDRAGHAAMGPVPVLREWCSAGEHLSLASALPNGASTILVGGGWIVLTDESQCCGLALRPLPNPTLDLERVAQEIRSALEAKGMRVQLSWKSGARVWKCPISGSGLSYAAFDPGDALRAVGAVWLDQFEQPWRIQYWFSSLHSDRAVALLESASP